MAEAPCLVGWWAAGWVNQSSQVEVMCLRVDSCFGLETVRVGVGRNLGWRSCLAPSPVLFCSASSSEERP